METVELIRKANYTRFYNANPEEITEEICYIHGVQHREYDWHIQVDLRWNDNKIQNYLNGYYSKEISEFNQIEGIIRYESKFNRIRFEE